MKVTGQRILIVGDSLSFPGATPKEITQDSNRRSAAPGDLLASMLLEAGAKAVRVNAKVGRSAISYLGSEPQLIADDLQWKPTRVIIMLGTNDTQRDPVRTAVALEELRRDYSSMGAEVWAVGPMVYVGAGAPLNVKAVPIVNMMQRTFGVRFIDARTLSATEGRAGDGIHFTATSAPPTAHAIAQALIAKRTVSPATWIYGGLGFGAIIALWLGSKYVAPRFALR